MRHIFIGVDVRQPVAFTALQHSIIARSSVPVAITPLLIDQLPITRRGLTDFTFTRYLVPHLMGYEGTALFLDADMLVLWDIEELFQLADPQYAVQVVKHDAERRFEWPSLMLFNCEKCQKLTPEYIEQNMPQTFEWGEVGALPADWNHLVGYDKQGPVKILHYTMGIPAFEEVHKLGYVRQWMDELQHACATVPWDELMGSSVHAQALEAK